MSWKSITLSWAMALGLLLLFSLIKQPMETMESRDRIISVPAMERTNDAETLQRPAAASPSVALPAHTLFTQI
ncbi:MAG: hypothetical protein SV765_17670 [Pseudomonadota bacterium]|nr:hypothetical protein [Pseudomonadales bacterium]MDY6922032.1 hypothetical protein [Pseudomonadota bacterium]|tara:strand:+ start:277 stop:495 length:219 start_codon:yes stop_codon:yes gene_type:complete